MRIVQKYGGTSVGTIEKIQNIARHLTKLKYAKIVKEEKEGQKIYFSINSNFIEKYNLLYESLLGNRVTHEIFMSDEVKYFENKDERCMSYEEGDV